MTDWPDYSRGHPPTDPDYTPGVWPLQPPRTSRFAVASLVLGAVGLVSCCLFLPSLLGTVFGFIALSEIKRGEAAGRGLGIAGVILSIIGLVAGASVWTLLIVSPDNAPIPGVEVAAKDRKTLEAMKVLEPDEEIELFCSSGTFSIREGGVIITERRLIVYFSSGPEDSFELKDVESIDYTPAASWIGDGNFIVTRDDGEMLSFTVDGMDQGDRVFHRTLERRVSKLRSDAGKPLPRTDTSTQPEKDSPLP